MKRNIFHIAFIAVAILLGGCSADNMDAPYCHITGKICYNGEAIGVRGSGSNSLTPTVQIEVWESGYGKEAALDVNVKQDGTFSTYVYPGAKRIVTKRGVGPWEQTDTLRVTVNGNKDIDLEVKPYFTISNVNYVYDKEANTLTASFHVTQIDGEATVKSMGLLVNNTQFVDMSNYKGSKTGGGQTGDVSFTLSLDDMKDKYHALYARVFVKADKSSYECYSTTPYHIW